MIHTCSSTQANTHESDLGSLCPFLIVFVLENGREESRGSLVNAFVCHVKYSVKCVCVGGLSPSFMYNCVCFVKKYIFGFGFISRTSKIAMNLQTYMVHQRYLLIRIQKHK
jgi:hypothetical protein